MQMKGKKRLLRPAEEPKTKRPGRPPIGGPEAKAKRDQAERDLREEKRIKKELRLAALQEKARLNRGPGRPKRDPNAPPTPRRRPNGTYYPVEFVGSRQRGVVDDAPKQIDRPPAEYSNKSAREKYGL